MVRPWHEILRPDGTRLCGPFLGVEHTCLLDTSGSFTIFVRDFTGVYTGNYHLYLQRLNPPVGCVNIASGAYSATGIIVQVAEANCFTFYGAAGEWIYRRVVRTSGTLTPYHEILRPDGTLLCGPYVIAQQVCLLDTSGIHTILVRDFPGPGTGNFTVYLYRAYLYLPLLLR